MSLISHQGVGGVREHVKIYAHASHAIINSCLSRLPSVSFRLSVEPGLLPLHAVLHCSLPSVVLAWRLNQSDSAFFSGVSLLYKRHV